MSAHAAEGEQADVTRALREEPPAPGGITDGWSGLTATAAPADPHAHHHHHHTTSTAEPSAAGAADAGGPPPRSQHAQHTKDAGYEQDGGHERQAGPEHEHHHHDSH